MTADPQARSYEEVVVALAEALGALEDTLTGLSEEDWSRPTLLEPADPLTPPWDVLQLASHFDTFMGRTLNLVEERRAGQAARDRVSYFISDRSKAAPAIYDWVVEHAAGHEPETMLQAVRETFKRALDAIRTTPPDTIGPSYFGALIRLDEFVATRVIEAVVHGMDLTDALGRTPLQMPKATPIAAEILDQLLARKTVPDRKTVPGRPPDLVGDDRLFIRVASGRGQHPDSRFPLIG